MVYNHLSYLKSWTGEKPFQLSYVGSHPKSLEKQFGQLIFLCRSLGIEYMSNELFINSDKNITYLTTELEQEKSQID